MMQFMDLIACVMMASLALVVVTSAIGFVYMTIALLRDLGPPGEDES